jgi:O-antigen ligase
MNRGGAGIVYSQEPAMAGRLSRTRQAREFLRMNGLAVALVFVAAFLAPCDRWRLTLEIKYSDVFFLAAAAAAVLEAFRHKGAIRMPLSFLVSLPLFLFTGLITYYLSDDATDLKELGHFLISAFGLPLLLAWTTSSSVTAIRTVLVGWVLGASFSAFVALLNKHGHFPFGSWDISIQYSGRFPGMALYHNELAAFSAMALPVMLMWLFDRQTPRLLRLAAVPLILLNFYAIQLSGSRAGLLSAFVAIVAFSYNWLRAQPVRGALMILGGMMVLLLSSTVSNCMQVGASTDCTLGAWERLLGGSGTDYSDQVRQRLLDEAKTQLESSPVVGVGFHAVRLSHNILLQLLVSGGVLGLGAFLLYLGTVVSWIRQLRPPDALLLRLHYLVPALYAGFASWVVNGMFQPDTVSRNYYMPVGLLLALRVYCAGLRERELAGRGVDGRQPHAAPG